ncbi:hypothetical protein FIBSPDRAFT_1048970 [Athelia psychrophila]|uniref:Uncharacterized protein n=1 Tax=Athelia psychrophila TaxID=1759441 RepID=A0A166D1P6_9AGAM|nr:hypothetical protein FIBSPDRAFT_1048970 [Fibularhizoctonia sp. CBS 109695]
MHSTQARASRDAPQQAILAGFIQGISRASTSTRSRLTKMTGESQPWVIQMGQLIDYSSSRLDHISDFKILQSFRNCARMLYTVRMRSSAHPDHQIFTADPQAQPKLDADARRLFEYLKVIKVEILNRAQASGAMERHLEAEEAWNGLIRDLKFEDETEAVAKEGIQSPHKGSDLEDLLLASSLVHQALESTNSQSAHGTIPDESPSPRSYWIDLHPIEDTGYEHGYTSEEPPVPLSHWVDLCAIEDYENLIPEAAPEPTSILLDLLPLDDSLIPEILPSPADFVLQLHELHESQLH